MKLLLIYNLVRVILGLHFLQFFFFFEQIFTVILRNIIACWSRFRFFHQIILEISQLHNLIPCVRLWVINNFHPISTTNYTNSSLFFNTHSRTNPPPHPLLSLGCYSQSHKFHHFSLILTVAQILHSLTWWVLTVAQINKLWSWVWSIDSSSYKKILKKRRRYYWFYPVSRTHSKFQNPSFATPQNFVEKKKIHCNFWSPFSPKGQISTRSVISHIYVEPTPDHDQVLRKTGPVESGPFKLRPTHLIIGPTLVMLRRKKLIGQEKPWGSKY